MIEINSNQKMLNAIEQVYDDNYAMVVQEINDIANNEVLTDEITYGKMVNNCHNLYGKLKS